MPTDYTAEQETIVKKVLSMDKNDYYKILHIEKSATEVEIKKSYRKLAVKLHPDKNKHPKAAEAFKKLAKAFEILSDDNKKRIYDQTGVDPDSRGSGGMSSGFSGFSNGASSGGNPYARHQNPFAAGGGGAQAFDAEDILNFMFGGGGQNSGFSTFGGGGNGFTFNFGGPGAGTDPFSAFAQAQRQQQQARRDARQQARQQQQQQPQTPLGQMLDMAKQLLPILLFLIVPLISTFFSDDDTTSATGSRLPKHSFEAQPSLPIQRHTTKYRIPYYINEKTFTNNGGYQDVDNPKLKTLDTRVEKQYINDLRYKCHRENLVKQDAIDDSRLFFFVNQKKLDEANAIQLPSCDKLSEMGLL